MQLKPLTKPRLLIVDDLVSNCEMIEEILQLEETEYEFLSVHSGDEALLVLDQEWDLVITDKNMPGKIDGIQLMHHIKEHTHSDVILMTGFPDLETAIDSVRGQAFDYLTKPISINAFRMAVRRCLEKRQLREDLHRERVLRFELQKTYEELKRMSKVKKIFGQFTTDDVVQFAFDNPDFWKKSEIKEATILFADVANFTEFTQDHDPIEVVKTVNGIHSCLFTAITEEGGAINKFLGDGLLAMFGVPVPLESHAERAVRAALKAQQKVEALNHLRAKEGLIELPIRIGVNTGDVVAGCVGTNERTEYTVMGHAVNCASRLEESAGAGEILIGAETFKQLNGKIPTELCGPQRFQGIKGDMDVHKVLKSVRETT